MAESNECGVILSPRWTCIKMYRNVRTLFEANRGLQGLWIKCFSIFIDKLPLNTDMEEPMESTIEPDI